MCNRTHAILEDWEADEAHARWQHGVNTNRREFALDAAQDLLRCLELGQEPKEWLERHKCSFIAWCDAHEVQGSAV